MVSWAKDKNYTGGQTPCVVFGKRYYFGAMAEVYFDNKLKDASCNVRHQQKTMDAFARLPEKFGVEDVMRCFGLNSDSTAYVRITRLMKDHLVQKIGKKKGEWA